MLLRSGEGVLLRGVCSFATGAAALDSRHWHKLRDSAVHVGNWCCSSQSAGDASLRSRRSGRRCRQLRFGAFVPRCAWPHAGMPAGDVRHQPAPMCVSRQASIVLSTGKAVLPRAGLCLHAAIRCPERPACRTWA